MGWGQGSEPCAEAHPDTFLKTQSKAGGTGKPVPYHRDAQLRAGYNNSGGFSL